MKRKYLNPLKQFVVFFAILHLTIVGLLSILTGSTSYFNAFYIISLNEFIPGINKGPVSFIFSLLFSVGVYLFFYFRQKK